MSLWSEDAPIVRVRRTEHAKPVTLIVPFYENHTFFARQLVDWEKWPADLLKHVAFIVVDDGSPHPLRPVLTSVNLRVFRIHTDVRWNWLAARNIGAHHAESEWLLLTDMDHVVPDTTMRTLVYGDLDGRVVYGFKRREYTGELIHPHSASFAMTRNLFWKVGGYDEALSGHYGTDGEYRRRLFAVAPLRILEDALVRHEHVGDSSTTRYARKQPEDAVVHQLVAARQAGWRPLVLSFPYDEVTPCH